MKTINIYYQAVTKVSLAQAVIGDHEDIENHIKAWMAQGYCKANITTDRIFVFIPWSSVVYFQYAS